jgi:hypothetical protein
MGTVAHCWDDANRETGRDWDEQVATMDTQRTTNLSLGNQPSRMLAWARAVMLAGFVALAGVMYWLDWRGDSLGRGEENATLHPP